MLQLLADNQVPLSVHDIAAQFKDASGIEAYIRDAPLSLETIGQVGTSDEGISYRRAAS